MIQRVKWYEWVKLQRWYIALFFLFTLSFNFNVFGLGGTDDWFANFQADSSAIVRKTVECKGVIEKYSGPLYVSEGKEFNDVMMQGGCSKGDFQPYVSQYGLQARVFSEIANVSSNFERNLKVISFFLTIALALLLTLLVKKMFNEFGRIPSVILTIGLLLSPWLAGFSYNAYWVVFTLFAPFVFSLWFYEPFKKKRLVLFYSVLLILFTLKFLNGYEYASTMVFAAFIPIAYVELRALSLRPLLQLWRQALMVFGVGVTAIVLAIVANVAGLKAYEGGWTEAFKTVGSRAELRSDAVNSQNDVTYSLRQTVPSVYDAIDRIYDLDKLSDGNGNPVAYVAVSTLNYALLPALSLPVYMKEPFGTVIQSIFVVGVFSGLVLKFLRERKYQVTTLSKLGVMYWLGLVGALSWLVLMPGHAYVHPHINAIVFYLPFLIICYIIIGYYLQYLWVRYGRK